MAEEKKVDAPAIRKLVAAVSAGVLDGTPVLDLNYAEDKAVTVDFNLVATEDGEFVEVQGSGEEATFSNEQLSEMLALGRKGIAELIAAQRAVLDLGTGERAFDFADRRSRQFPRRQKRNRERRQ